MAEINYDIKAMLEGIEKQVTETREANKKEREHQTVAIDYKGDWAKDVYLRAGEFIAQIGQATASTPCLQLAQLLNVLKQGICPVPYDCEHVDSRPFEPHIQHLCFDCFQKYYENFSLPIPMIVENLKFDSTDKEQPPFRYAICKFAFMMVPSRMGYSDSWSGCLDLLGAMKDQAAIDEKIKEIEANAANRRNGVDSTTQPNSTRFEDNN